MRFNVENKSPFSRLWLGEGVALSFTNGLTMDEKETEMLETAEKEIALSTFS